LPFFNWNLQSGAKLGVRSNYIINQICQFMFQHSWWPCYFMRRSLFK
jgi:hypothetical protein